MSENTHAGFCVRTTWQQCAGLVRPLETLQTQGLSCHIARPLQKVKSFYAGRVPTESTQPYMHGASEDAGMKASIIGPRGRNRQQRQTNTKNEPRTREPTLHSLCQASWREAEMGGKPQRNEPTVRQAIQCCSRCTIPPPRRPPRTYIYNNHRQLTWRTADFYLLAMATLYTDRVGSTKRAFDSTLQLDATYFKYNTTRRRKIHKQRPELSIFSEIVLRLTTATIKQHQNILHTALEMEEHHHNFTLQEWTDVTMFPTQNSQIHGQ